MYLKLRAMLCEEVSTAPAGVLRTRNRVPRVCSVQRDVVGPRNGSTRIQQGSQCPMWRCSMWRCQPWVRGLGGDHSHSIVDGGFDEMSYATRLIPGTSLITRDEIEANTS